MTEKKDWIARAVERTPEQRAEQRPSAEPPETAATPT
jgi:hypothetical protein